jgi:hypothetical protein
MPRAPVSPLQRPRTARFLRAEDIRYRDSAVPGPTSILLSWTMVFCVQRADLRKDIDGIFFTIFGSSKLE